MSPVKMAKGEFSIESVGHITRVSEMMENKNKDRINKWNVDKNESNYIDDFIENNDL